MLKEYSLPAYGADRWDPADYSLLCPWSTVCRAHGRNVNQMEKGTYFLEGNERGPALTSPNRSLAFSPYARPKVGRSAMTARRQPSGTHQEHQLDLAKRPEGSRSMERRLRRRASSPELPAAAGLATAPRWLKFSRKGAHLHLVRRLLELPDRSTADDGNRNLAGGKNRGGGKGENGGNNEMSSFLPN